MMLNSTYNEVLTSFTETETMDFMLFSILFTTIFIGPWILMTKLFWSFLNLIEDIYIDYIGYKYFLKTMILPDLEERKNWCKKTDWIVEWRGHQRMSRFRDMDGQFIYTNTETNEEYVAGIDDGHPEDSF